MQTFNHRERRFVVACGSREDRMLLALDGGRAYEVVTDYLDTPERTWSSPTFGEDAPKIRFRTYDSGDSFLERKLHSLGTTAKERESCEVIPSGLITLGTIAYKRTEYIVEECRVTVDRDIIGSNGVGQEPFVIVETKGKFPNALRYLKPFEEKRFSKWKWFSGLFSIASCYALTSKEIWETPHSTT